MQSHYSTLQIKCRLVTMNRKSTSLCMVRIALDMIRFHLKKELTGYMTIQMKYVNRLNHLLITDGGQKQMNLGLFLRGLLNGLILLLRVSALCHRFQCVWMDRIMDFSTFQLCSVILWVEKRQTLHPKRFLKISTKW